MMRLRAHTFEIALLKRPSATLLFVHKDTSVYPIDFSNVDVS